MGLARARPDGTRKNGNARSYGAVHVFDIAGGKVRRFREYVDIPNRSN